MNKDKKECIEIIEKLDLEILNNVLVYIQIAYIAQENTKKQYGIPSAIDTTGYKEQAVQAGLTA